MIAMRAMRAMWCVVLAMWLIGCGSSPAVRTPVPRVSYGDIVQRYNANLAGLDRMWARAVVEFRYEDQHGRSRYEQAGASKLMLERPDRLALSITAMDRTYFWMGSNERRYWLIDLTEQRLAYIGEHALMDQARQRDWPIHIRPLDLPMLLGIVTLDPAAKGTVRREQGYYQITPPGGVGRLTLDPDTALPVRVELFDRRGRLDAVSELSKPQRVELHGKHPDRRPTMMSRMEITSPQTEGWIRLHLSDMTDARGPDDSSKARALKQAFDLPFLLNALRVEKIIDVDRQ